MKKTLLSGIILLLFFHCFAQKNLTFKSKLSFPVSLANIWGYVDTAGNEYALVGTGSGISIVDVTVPTNPIEKFKVSGPNSIWREIRTKDKYAFVTTEGGGGLQIVDLSYLPDTVYYKNWTGDDIIAGQLSSIHALQVDGNFLYLYGSNIGSSGALIIYVIDPWNPTYVGQYDASYIHDGYVRNDTMWSGHIFGGYFSVVRTFNKSVPQLLASQNTPGNFTHNTWLSDNSKTLFTTDEIDNSFLTAFDVSNLSNIKETDRVQSNPGSNSVVHNTHVLNDYCVTSWYKDGVIIVDGSRPKNLVIVGNYDTSPSSGSGMDGCWGVYPFLPSGNIVASDMQEGLYVLTPNYVRACYLEGIVTDTITGAVLDNVTAILLPDSTTEKSNTNGEYYLGIADSGTYSASFSKYGYYSKTVSSLSLKNGVVTQLNVQLMPQTSFSLTGNVKNSNNSTLINNATIMLEGGGDTLTVKSDSLGNFKFDTVFTGYFNITVGKWGYISDCISNKLFSISSNTVFFVLDTGYYDDFAFDFGWTISSTAAAGIWTRGEPVGTEYNISGDSNPEYDVTNDCSEKCFVTGNAGGSAGNDDVDDGNTILTSPIFDLSSYSAPYISYYRWFFNDGGAGNVNDSLVIKISNGIDINRIELITAASATMSKWNQMIIKVKDFITPTATMKILFEVGDDISNGHIVEAGIDMFLAFDSLGIGFNENTTYNNNFINLNVFPNPFDHTATIIYTLNGNQNNDMFLNIFDLLGRRIAAFSLTDKHGEIKLNHVLEPGIYFLEIKNKNSLVAVKKVIKL